MSGLAHLETYSAAIPLTIFISVSFDLAWCRKFYIGEVGAEIKIRTVL
jgi:hypothetical protein